MSSQSKERFPSISVVSHKFADDGQLKPGAKIACDKCDATHVVRLTGPFNAYHAAERFKKAGWSIEAKATRCPSCVSNGRRTPATAKGDSKLGAQLRLVVPGSPIESPSPFALNANAPAFSQDDVDAMSDAFKRAAFSIPAIPPAAVAPALSDASAPAAKESEPVTSAPTEPSRAVLTSAAQPRALTVEERAKVRRDLDAVFDDAAGMYLDGASDRTIADKHKLPWASVAAYREAAYGPIRTDSELEALRKALTGVREFLEGRIREMESAIKEDRAAVKSVLAEGERNFQQWKKAVETRQDENAKTFRDGLAGLRESLVAVNVRIDDAARARGLKV